MKGSLHSLWLLLFKCYSGNRLFIATLDMGIFILRKREVFPPQLIYQVYRIYINRKSVIYSPRASQNCKLQFQAKQCCNIFQENMSTWAVPFCTWHSLQRFSSTGDRSKDCPLINGHTCSVAISWTSTTCFGAITPRTPSRPLRFWN